MVYSLAVTGPLGTGKTTFLRNLNNALLTHSPEDRYSNTYFAFNDLHKSSLFPKRFDSEFDSYAFQLSCMLSNYEQIHRCESSQLDYITDFYFGETLQTYGMTYHKMGLINTEQVNSLLDINYNLLSNIPLPKKIIYIKYDSPKEIVNNILARGRYDESEENKEFMESFVTYLLDDFDTLIENIKMIKFDVITLRQNELDKFIDDFCKQEKLLVS